MHGPQTCSCTGAGVRSTGACVVEAALKCSRV